MVLEALEPAPGLAARARTAERTDRFRQTGVLPNFYRRPYGAGWALVGDAGYHKDPILDLGIGDAFRDAELLAAAVDAGLAGPRAARPGAGRVGAAPQRALGPRLPEHDRLRPPRAAVAAAARGVPRQPGGQ